LKEQLFGRLWQQHAAPLGMRVFLGPRRVFLVFSCFKSVVIFLGIKTKPAKIATLLKEMMIAQLSS
jgi:hypothetical protein